MQDWRDSSAVAALSSISERKARRAFQRSIERELPWRGASLIVRQVRGRGGRSGMRYEVRLDSLPIELQHRFNASRSAVDRPLTHGAKAQAERDWWYGLIQPALAFEKHSRERGAAIKSIVAGRHLRPDGKRVQVTERTVQRKLDAYERGGLGALSRAKRVDCGARKVILCRAWDKAVAFNDATKERIAHELRQYVRAMTAAGEPNGPMFWMMASNRLTELTIEAGFEVAQDQMAKICRVPANLIEAEKDYRKAHILTSDRKRHEDNKPRVRRTIAGMRPMELVVGDVHPIDILVRREDGSIATARLIGWLDVSTKRLWADVALLEKGTGIRNGHIIASFINMANAWGAPDGLYLDNGTEYNCAEFIDDALKLVAADRRAISNVSLLGDDRRSQVIRAQAYNAAAKPIEGVFARLEKAHLAVISGYIGGDRMRKKSANVGRDAVPFAGTFEEFKSVFAAMLGTYNRIPQHRGELKGKSPYGALSAAISAGWQRTAVDADAFRVAFAEERSFTVRQGSITFDNRRWTSRELQAFNGDEVIVRIPRFDDWTRLPIFDGAGRLLGFVEPDLAYSYLDPAGAREAKSRSSRKLASVQGLRRGLPDVNRLGEHMKLANSLPGQPDQPIGATLSASPEVTAIVQRLKETPQERERRELSEASAQAREKIEHDERIEALIRRNA